MNEDDKKMATKWEEEKKAREACRAKEEARWNSVFFTCNHTMPYPHKLDVDLVSVGIDPYLDTGILMCLSCDEDGNALISMDDTTKSGIEFRTLPLNVGKIHGLWFNRSQMEALKHVLDTILENSEA